MIVPSRSIPFLSLVLACALLVDCADAAIELISSEINASAQNTTTGAIGNSVSFTSLTANPPVNLNVSHTNLSNGTSSHSFNEISFATISGQTVLSVQMDHQRNGHGNPNQYDALAHTSAGLGGSGNGIVFSVDADTPYMMAGEYNFNFNSGGYVRFLVSLSPTSGGGPLFEAIFDPGFLTSGDDAWVVSGPGSSGVLLPGEYQWQFFAELVAESPPEDNPVGTALGFVSLTLGEATDPGVVPEATSFLTWGLLALTGVGTATGRRWRI